MPLKHMPKKYTILSHFGGLFQTNQSMQDGFHHQTTTIPGLIGIFNRQKPPHKGSLRFQLLVSYLKEMGPCFGGVAGKHKEVSPLEKDTPT